jgi:transcriptional regulator with XRE-family HTH domain
MITGDRLRELREGKSLSQGDIEKRTGLLRWVSIAESFSRNFQTYQQQPAAAVRNCNDV